MANIVKSGKFMECIRLSLQNQMNKGKDLKFDIMSEYFNRMQKMYSIHSECYIFLNEKLGKMI